MYRYLQLHLVWCWQVYHLMYGIQMTICTNLVQYRALSAETTVHNNNSFK